MYSEKYQKKNQILEIIMGIGLFATIFLAGKYRFLGFMGIGAIALALVINLKYRKIYVHTKLQKAIIINLIYMICHFIIFICMGKLYDNSFYYFIQQICIYIYLFVIVGNKIDNEGTEKIARVYSIFMIIVLLCLYMKDLNLLERSSLFNTQLGMCMLPTLSYFILAAKNKKIRYIIIPFVIITVYFSGARSALGALLIFFITYIVWNKIKKNPKIAKIYFGIVIVLCILIPIIYLQLCNNWLGLGDTVNEIVIKYTGTRLFSGRDAFWPYIIEKILSAPIFGNGIGISVSEIYDTNFSTHNLFFFILLQTGVVGLIIYIYMMYCMWEEYLKIDKKDGKVFAAFLVAILIQQTFSLGLLSGKMALAIPSWTLLALGVTYTKKNKNIEEIKGEEDSVTDSKCSIPRTK